MDYSTDIISERYPLYICYCDDYIYESADCNFYGG